VSSRGIDAGGPGGGFTPHRGEEGLCAGRRRTGPLRQPSSATPVWLAWRLTGGSRPTVVLGGFPRWVPPYRCPPLHGVGWVRGVEVTDTDTAPRVGLEAGGGFHHSGPSVGPVGRGRGDEAGVL